MVYAQESSPGKLIFRHAVTLKELPAENRPDLSSDEWSSVTRIARSNNFFESCSKCQGFRWLVKFAFLYPNPRSGSSQLVRLGSPIESIMRLFVYIRGGGSSIVTGRCALSVSGIDDFVHFNGQIYGCGKDGSLLVLDHTKLELIELIPCDTIRRRHGMSWERLVAWDGDLYFVVVYPVDPPDCYRLVVQGKHCRWERVEDLRDGVVFITKDCVFSVSARDLPAPCRGKLHCLFYRVTFDVPLCRLED